MKAPLYPLLFGAIMLGLGGFHYVLTKRRAAGLTGQDAQATQRLARTFLIQLLVVVAIIWLAAAVLYLRGTQIDYATWSKWFSGVMVVLLAGIAALVHILFGRKIKRLDPSQTEAIQALEEARRKVAPWFGFMAGVMLFFFISSLF